MLSSPKGWEATIGAQPFTLAPTEADSWIVGISIPARAAAGRYVIAIGAKIGNITVAVDSAVVNVNESRAIAVAAVDRPLYVVSGDMYELGFRLYNRGNVSETIRLSATSSLLGIVKIDTSLVTLAGGESRPVRVAVSTRKSSRNDADDILELRAIPASDASLKETASARIIIVRKPGSMAPMVTVPAVLRVRAGSTASGVSPYELVGGGRISNDRPEEMEFVFRGRTARNSILGERSENRVEIRAPHYAARIGDNYYALSPLTGGGQTGLGGGLELKSSSLSSGIYFQKYRFLPGGQREHGAFLRFEPSGRLLGSRISLNAVERMGGFLAGKIYSSAVTLHPIGDMLLDAELATSRGDSGNASGRMLRLNGSALGRFHYDFGQMAGGALFLGPGRNAENDFANLSVDATSRLRLKGSVNVGNFRFGPDTMVSAQRFITSTVGGTYAGGFSLEYSEIGRRSSAGSTSADRTQGVLRTRLERGTRVGNFWATAELGKRSDSLERGAFHQMSFGASVMGGPASISLYTDLYDGGSMMRGPAGGTLFGVNGSLALNRTNTLSLGGFTSRIHSAGAGRYTQFDSRLTHTLANGSSVTARYRFSAAPSSGVASTKLFYLEYGLPLRLPTGRLHIPGKVSGRVMDSETNRPVAGALVRVGSQAAVTDREGKVSFAGLTPGEYRVSLASETSLANAAVVGNPVVRIDSLRHDAPSFSLAVSRASKVKGIVRQFAIARTAIADAADSLVESGPLEGITVALIGSRDTLYRTTAVDGKFLFGEVPGGNWTMLVTDDAPVAFRYERQSVQVTTSPGKEADVEFRLVPRHKQVQIVASGDAPSIIASPSGQEAKHK